MIIQYYYNNWIKEYGNYVSLFLNKQDIWTYFINKTLTKCL